MRLLLWLLRLPHDHRPHRGGPRQWDIRRDNRRHLKWRLLLLRQLYLLLQLLWLTNIDIRPHDHIRRMRMRMPVSPSHNCTRSPRHICKSTHPQRRRVSPFDSVVPISYRRRGRCRNTDAACHTHSQETWVLEGRKKALTLMGRRGLNLGLEGCVDVHVKSLG